MKKYFYFLLFSFVFFGSKLVYGQWKIEACPTKENLNGLSVAGWNSYWIVGNSGTILYKNKNEWKSYPMSITEDLYGVDFINKNDGWAVGANGTIIHFDGLVWKVVPSPTKNDLFSVSFKDAENGTAVGKLGTVLIYKNDVWNLIANNNRGNFNTATFNNNDIWLGGGLECINFPIIKIQNTINNELTFTKNSESFATLKSICFINSSNGWAVGSPSTILHYNGLTWTKSIVNERFSSLNDVYFSDENDGISVGYNGTVLCYKDDKWTKEKTPTSMNLNGALIRDNYYYAVGDSGTILLKDMNLSIDNSSLTENITPRINHIPDVSQDISTKPLNLPLLLELIPNPCDNMLNVRLVSGNIYEHGLITLTNIYGQVLLQKEIVFNDNNINYLIKTESFESGIYILKLTIRGKSTTHVFAISH